MNFLRKLIKSVFGASGEEPPSPIHKIRQFRSRSSIIGKTGRTLTNLATTGLIEIDGKEFEAESKSGFLKMNVPVRIVGKHMSWFLVEAI